MPAIRRHWTPADVRDLMDEKRPWPRYELIDGELLVTPSPGTPHQHAVQELYVIIAPHVEQEALGLTMLSPADLELKKGDITQPDLFVFSAEPDDGDTIMRWTDVKSLVLAVEVISPSSIRTDRVTKRDHYLTSNVAEYWIVDLDARVVERWTPERETPLLDRETLTWRPVGAIGALTIDLPAFFERVQRRARWVPR